MARSQPIVYTHSHSVTTSRTPPPALLVHLLYSNSLSQFFFFVLSSFCSPQSHVSATLSTAPLKGRQSEAIQVSPVGFTYIGISSDWAKTAQAIQSFTVKLKLFLLLSRQWIKPSNKWYGFCVYVKIINQHTHTYRYMHTQTHVLSPCDSFEKKPKKNDLHKILLSKESLKGAVYHTPLCLQSANTTKW